MTKYYLAVEIDGIISKFEATFPSEEEANRFADIVHDHILEFSFVSTIDAMRSNNQPVI